MDISRTTLLNSIREATRTVADGTVTQAGYAGAAGNMVVIRHANGFETQYMHLSRFGDGVRAG